MSRIRSLGAARSLAGLVVVLALAGAACSSNSGASGGGATTPPTTQTTTPPVLVTSPPSSPSASPSATGGGGAKAAVLKQGVGGAPAFGPKKLTVTQGQSLTVTNVGTGSHTFTITSAGINLINAVGQSKTVKITLAPGKYHFICTFHVALGMVGTLIVK